MTLYTIQLLPNRLLLPVRGRLVLPGPHWQHAAEAGGCVHLRGHLQLRERPRVVLRCRAVLHIHHRRVHGGAAEQRSPGVLRVHHSGHRRRGHQPLRGAWDMHARVVRWEAC
jgi:hypothetical protein